MIKSNYTEFTALRRKCSCFKEGNVMIEHTIAKIEKIFYEHLGYATCTQLTNSGIDSRTVKKMIMENYIIRIKRGLYRWSTYPSESQEDMVLTARMIPTSVICLYSALVHYDMSTYNPPEITVAVERHFQKPKLPDYPPVKLFYYSPMQYSLGITEIDVDGNKIKIYDIEKTICDCIRYRNKIGMDIIKEVLKEYVRRKDKNLQKLMEYAKSLRIKTVLIPYMEALV